ncbi:MAG: hypothetical protein FWC45_03670, partial [Treponema sp.]|nr:hypothetical protein [Treponema sp.]
MPDREKDELWLLGVLRSQKAGKAAAVLCIAGMIICILLLLPPVQGFLVPFAASYASLPFIVLAVLAFAVCCLFAKEFSAFLEKAGNSRLISAFAIIILAACLGFIGIFSYRHGWQWIDSDQSSEMVLGKLLAEENALVSANWFYGNEIRLVHQIIFTMPLFKLLGHNGNWALIRSLNIMLNNLVLLFSCIFMMQQLKVQRKWILISSVFLLIPLSVEYWDIVTFGGNYIFFIAQFFFCFGLFIRAKKIGPAFVLFLTASCILGMQGIRTLYSFHIPLLLTCIYIRVTMTPKKNFPLFLGSAGFIACCSGYAVNCLLHFWFKFQSYDIMTLDNIFANFFSKLSRSLATLAGFFGFAAGKPLLSASGFFGIAAIIVTFIVLGIIFKVFRQRQFKAAEQFVPVFFGVSVLFNVFIFIISNQSILSRYFLPFMVFYIPLAAILFAYAEKSFGYVKR